MQLHFTSNQSDSLIFLLNGWGCDERPYQHLQSGSDILIASDYTNADVDFDFSPYTDIF